MRRLIWILPPLLLLSACVKQQESHSSQEALTTTSTYIPHYVPDRVIEERRSLQTAWSHLQQGDQWTVWTQKAIGKYGQGLLRSTPRDIERYCPRYAQLGIVGRGDFWVNLISKLAYSESGYNPEATYTERFRDNHGNRVVSRGLLQISQESANGYGCGIEEARVLHNPKVNLECGVRIMNRWITRDGVITAQEGSKWRGLARYWSPFRDPNRAEKIATYTAGLPYCQ